MTVDILLYGLRQGTIEEKAAVTFTAEKSAEVLVEYTNTPPSGTEGGGERSNAQPALMLGVVCDNCAELRAVVLTIFLLIVASRWLRENRS